MVYLSRGEVISETERTVLFRGKTFILTKEEWGLWKNGNCSFARSVKSNFFNTSDVLQKLLADGIIINCSEDKSFSDVKYETLVSSVITIKPQGKVVPLVFGDEKRIMDWLTLAGFPLTTEEIIFLLEKNIEPTKDLVGEKNKQALIATIYPDGKIENNALVKKMAVSKHRDYVVNIILGMLKKRYIVLN